MNFKNAIDNVSNINPKKNKIDVSTWGQYRLKDGKIKCLNPPQELTEEEKKQEVIDTLSKISFAIEVNMYKYMINYDKIHGDGAYDRLYYLEPIYDDLDLNLDLEFELESELEIKSNENINYEQNVYCYH